MREDEVDPGRRRVFGQRVERGEREYGSHEQAGGEHDQAPSGRTAPGCAHPYLTPRRIRGASLRARFAMMES